MLTHQAPAIAVVNRAVQLPTARSEIQPQRIAAVLSQRVTIDRLEKSRLRQAFLKAIPTRASVARAVHGQRAAVGHPRLIRVMRHEVAGIRIPRIDRRRKTKLARQPGAHAHPRLAVVVRAVLAEVVLLPQPPPLSGVREQRMDAGRHLLQVGRQVIGAQAGVARLPVLTAVVRGKHPGRRAAHDHARRIVAINGDVMEHQPRRARFPVLAERMLAQRPHLFPALAVIVRAEQRARHDPREQRTRHAAGLDRPDRLDRTLAVVERRSPRFNPGLAQVFGEMQPRPPLPVVGRAPDLAAARVKRGVIHDPPAALQLRPFPLRAVIGTPPDQQSLACTDQQSGFAHF